jgi:pimeloyl-ACP methyl ester carboxylesterase
MTAPHPLTQELRFAHVPSGTRIAWASNGQGPVLVRAAHWMTHVEHDPRSPLWRPWLERLGRTLHLVRYDERGCGSSASDGSAPGLDSAVQDLAAVVQACGAERVALLGISGAAPAAVAPTALTELSCSRASALAAALAAAAATPATALPKRTPRS